MGWLLLGMIQYQNADHWFHNLDKIIHYVNYNASKGGPVVAFYSTPSHYVDAKFAATKEAHAKWEVRHDDIFPLGDAPHNYWSGYFTSRPGLKRQVRPASEPSSPDLFCACRLGLGSLTNIGREFCVCDVRAVCGFLPC